MPSLINMLLPCFQAEVEDSSWLIKMKQMAKALPLSEHFRKVIEMSELSKISTATQWATQIPTHISMKELEIRIRAQLINFQEI